jgi:hypothetical protein
VRYFFVVASGLQQIFFPVTSETATKIFSVASSVATRDFIKLHVRLQLISSSCVSGIVTVIFCWFC